MATDLVVPGGEPGGMYRVGYLPKAQREGRELLSEPQYAYAVRQAERLRHWGNQDEIAALRTEAVENFYELKLKGNVLGKTNLRIFFAVLDAGGERFVIILGVYKKEEEDQLPRHLVITMKHRRSFAEGQLHALVRRDTS